LSAIAAYGAWPVLAAQEIGQHMGRFLEALPLEELRAIAQSKIILNELARQVLVELDRE
jgi:hypothetical protein